MAENTLRPALDAVQQAKAGMDSGAWFVTLAERAFFHAQGRHRARFLHNFTTCQVKELAPQHGRWGAVTSGQGGIVSMALIHNDGESLRIEVGAAQREEVIAHLTKYRIADQVTFHDDDTLAAVSLIGDGAAGLAAAVGLTWPAAVDESWQEQDWNGCLARVYADHFRWGSPSLDVTVPAERLADLEAALLAAGFHKASAERQAAHRVAHGVPRERTDVDTDTTPLEAAHLRSVVDWNKGCYLGQEVICMMEDLGKPRKMLVEVAFDDEVPAGGVALANDSGKTVGWLGTTASIDGAAYGLATIKRKHAKPGITLRAESGEGMTVVNTAGIQGNSQE